MDNFIEWFEDYSEEIYDSLVDLMDDTAEYYAEDYDRLLESFYDEIDVMYMDWCLLQQEYMYDEAKDAYYYDEYQREKDI